MLNSKGRPAGSHSHPEFYLAFHAGLKPKDLEARGYPKSSIYNLYRRYNREVKQAFEELLKMPLIAEKPKE